MLFERPFHPSLKWCIFISWGKHWTENFMDLSHSGLKEPVKVPLGSNVGLPPCAPSGLRPPEDTSRPQAALTSTRYRRCRLFSAFAIQTTSLCLPVFCRNVAFLCKYFLCTVPSILGAIFVAIKYEAVVLLEKESQWKRHGNRLCIIYFFFSCLELSLKSKCQHFKIIYTQERF